MPSLTWGDNGWEDAKSEPTGQRVNHQLQRVSRTVSFKVTAHPHWGFHLPRKSVSVWLNRRDCSGVCRLCLIDILLAHLLALLHRPNYTFYHSYWCVLVWSVGNFSCIINHSCDLVLIWNKLVSKGRDIPSQIVFISDGSKQLRFDDVVAQSSPQNCTVYCGGIQLGLSGKCRVL